MGGDNAPEAPVLGALAALSTHPIRVLLVGETERVQAVLKRAHRADRERGLPRSVAWDDSRFEIVHADEVVAMDEAPSAALDRRDRTSMGRAARLVKEGAADAYVSAGNTGALMAISLFTVGRAHGIRRPAIAVLWPTREKPVLVLDSGANADSRAEFLVQFAHMGSVYMEHVMGRRPPRVGLLNIGGEAGKGSNLMNAAFGLLEKADIEFVGNVEPGAMLAGAVDVAVTDGFVGNMALKTGEAVAEMILGFLKEGIRSSWRAKIGALLLRPVLLGLKRRIDQSEYGGAPLLGLQGVVIKAHGRADAKAVANAIGVAVQAVQSGVVHQIGARLAAKAGPPGPHAPSAAEAGGGAEAARD